MNSSANFNIRHLAPDDVDLMRDLLGVFGEAFGEEATYCDNQPQADYLRRLLGMDHVIVLVALAAGQVTGGLVAYEFAKFEQARSEIYIYDLAVSEAHRRQGVATALIKKTERIAAARGAYVVIVQADNTDAPAIELYSGLGVREDVVHFDIAVKGRKQR